MSENSNDKHYDLEDRTAEFVGDVAVFCNKILNIFSNLEHCKQVIRSSGSIASNYIEANESLSKKDFLYRMKICRKEAKETAMWFRVMHKTNEPKDIKQIEAFCSEATELKKIFSAIINKSGE
jgi:four helix bundle protein